MYTDSTILSFGKYKFHKLGNIPPSYLLNIYNNKSFKDGDLLQYIEANLEKIQNMKEGRVEQVLSNSFFVCEKLTFATEKIAKQALKDIKNTPQKHKKPIRVYECDKCGGWHLTSQEKNYTIHQKT